MGGGIELEHNAAAVRATFGGRAVEGAFRVEYKSSNGKCAVGVVLEGVQDRQHMGGGIELEHRAAAARGAAKSSRAVEGAFRIEHQRSLGLCAVGAGEDVKRLEGCCISRRAGGEHRHAQEKSKETCDDRHG